MVTRTFSKISFSWSKSKSHQLSANTLEKYGSIISHMIFNKNLAVNLQPFENFNLFRIKLLKYFNKIIL